MRSLYSVKVVRKRLRLSGEGLFVLGDLPLPSHCDKEFKEHARESGGTTTIRPRADASGIAGVSILDDLATRFAADMTYETCAKQPYGLIQSSPSRSVRGSAGWVGDGGVSAEGLHGPRPRFPRTRLLIPRTSLQIRSHGLRITLHSHTSGRASWMALWWDRTGSHRIAPK